MLRLTLVAHAIQVLIQTRALPPLIKALGKLIKHALVSEPADFKMGSSCWVISLLSSWRTSVNIRLFP